MSERDKLMKRIQIHDFALLESALFLDTHPDNISALCQYSEQKKMKNKYLKEYETKYGPITNDFNYDDHWDWVATPWPWEMED